MDEMDCCRAKVLDEHVLKSVKHEEIHLTA